MNKKRNRIKKAILCAAVSAVMTAEVAAVPVAADTGNYASAARISGFSGTEASIGDSLKSLFGAFFSLFGSDEDESDTGETGDSDTTTDYGVSIMFTEINPDTGKFTITASDDSFFSSYSDSEMIIRVTFDGDTDNAVDYTAEQDSDGNWTAEGDVADFSHSAGTYEATLYEADEDGNATGSALASAQADVELENYVYAEVPEDGYGTAVLYDVNPVLSDGSEVQQVQFAVTLDSEETDEDTEESESNDSLLIDETDNTAADASDGEIIYDAEESSDGVWSVDVSAADFESGGTFTAVAWCSSEASDSTESSSESSVTYEASETYGPEDSYGTEDTSIEETDSGETVLVCDSESGSTDFELKMYTSNETEVPELLQNPELPTGCESVALTIDLMSLGFDLEKTTIAEDYLVMGSNYACSFVGDPFTEHGSGIFPPGIVETANDYLADQDSELQAYDISGTDLDDLLTYIDKGEPVLVWTTMYMASVNFTGASQEYMGKTYRWYSDEHCVVLYGYDRSTGTLLISDPLEGLVERDWDDFEEIYDEIGQYAVVIE
jgi:uncharacterized protein YvpB